MSKTRTTILLSGNYEGQSWRIVVVTTETGGFQGKGTFIFDYAYKDVSEERKKKGRLRVTDRKWVQRNIPSSIVWNTQVHHDWEDGGRMYLLTKGEHILRHRREK